MSVDAMSWVFKHSPYEGRERLVHLAIADVANDDHDYRVWIKQESLAHKARCSVDTVARAVHKMVEQGFLVLEEKGGGRGRPDVYRFVMKTPQNAVVSNKTPHPGRENPAFPTSSPLVNSKELKGEKPRILHAGIMTSRRSGPTDFSDADPNVKERVAEIRASLAAK